MHFNPCPNYSIDSRRSSKNDNPQKSRQLGTFVLHDVHFHISSVDSQDLYNICTASLPHEVPTYNLAPPDFAIPRKILFIGDCIVRCRIQTSCESLVADQLAVFMDKALWTGQRAFKNRRPFNLEINLAPHADTRTHNSGTTIGAVMFSCNGFL